MKAEFYQPYKEKQVMARLYNLDDTRLTAIYGKAGSYLHLVKELDSYFSELVQKKEVSLKKKHSFLSAVRTRAKKLNIVKEHHFAKYSFRFWDDARKKEFTRTVRKIIREKLHMKVLLSDFPELGSINVVHYTINVFIPGGLKKIRESVALSGSPELDAKREELSDEDNETLDILLKFIKTKRVMRVGDAAEFTKIEKGIMRGILVNFSGKGFFVNVPGEHHLFFANTPEFYTPEELLKILPRQEQDRIANIIHMGPISADRLAQQLYGRSSNGNSFLVTYLSNLIRRGFLELSDDIYLLTMKGVEFGTDAQSVITNDAVELENKLMVQSEERSRPFRSLAEVKSAVQDDLEGKLVKPIDITHAIPENGFSFLVISEILFGNQYTDVALLESILSMVNPDFSITSGLVQGTFTARNVKRQLELVQNRKLYKIGQQLSAAARFMEDLEKVTKGPVCVVQGDDDLRIAEDYADLAQLREGKSWTFGVNMHSLSAELKRRLSIREYNVKREIQNRIIVPYQYRTKRALKNAKEVFEAIGVSKSEYRLIIEILIAQKLGKFPYPEVYENVVDVKALFGDIGKNIVTPDSLMLKVGERIIQFVHNTNFSDVTQYADPLLTSEKIMRHMMSRDYEKLPWMLIDGHQEFFYGTYVQGHWVMTAPGMQNALSGAMHQQKTTTYRVLQSKSLRQNTFRKSPATPGAIELGVLTEGGIERDGRIRLRILNDKIIKVLDSEKKKPHKKEIVALLTDLQFGSITMQPELVIKYLDYALYTKRASKLRGNGDWLQGVIYPMFFAENRPIRLTSVDSQQRFTLDLLVPPMKNAPELNDVALWQGNHEWGIWGNSLTGENALYFFESALQLYNQGLIDAGGKAKFQQAQTISRISMARTTNPKGDRILFPYFAEEIAGFKAAYMHMWQPHGGGRTPVDQPRRWIINMAHAAGDIDLLVGGDKHSLWMAQEAGKILLQAPAAASQSGYELARGLMSTVLFTVLEFDNHEGITLEFVPWQFLENYKCIGPDYRGKDDLLKVPDEGSREYSLGRYSPLIEQKLDELTFYKKM